MIHTVIVSGSRTPSCQMTYGGNTAWARGFIAGVKAMGGVVVSVEPELPEEKPTSAPGAAPPPDWPRATMRRLRDDDI